MFLGWAKAGAGTEVESFFGGGELGIGLQRGPKITFRTSGLYRWLTIHCRKLKFRCCNALTCLCPYAKLHTIPTFRSQVSVLQRKHSKLLFFHACSNFHVSQRIFLRWIEKSCAKLTYSSPVWTSCFTLATRRRPLVQATEPEKHKAGIFDQIFYHHSFHWKTDNENWSNESVQGTSQRRAISRFLL